jgi:hypothetical protein
MIQRLVLVPWVLALALASAQQFVQELLMLLVAAAQARVVVATRQAGLVPWVLAPLMVLVLHSLGP